MDGAEALVNQITRQVLQVLEHTDGSKDKEFGKGVPVGVSNRHVHLSEKDMQILFGAGHQLKPVRELTQTGEFACEEIVTLAAGERMLEKVRILGPCRAETQVEISQTDARFLKKKPPVRNSGDLAGSETITIIGPKGKVELSKGCILATRHLHLSPEDGERFGIRNNQIVSARLFGEKPGMIDQVYCKIKKGYVPELHLDTDDANAFLVESGDVAQIII